MLNRDRKQNSDLERWKRDQQHGRGKVIRFIMKSVVISEGEGKSLGRLGSLAWIQMSFEERRYLNTWASDAEGILEEKP